MPFQKGRLKTGGRVAVVPNKKTAERERAESQANEDRHRAIEEALRAVPEDVLVNMAPLDCLLSLMRICYRFGDRYGAQSAATAAAPYVHMRLSASDVRVHHTLEDRPDAELVAELQALESKFDIADKAKLIEGKAVAEVD